MSDNKLAFYDFSGGINTSSTQVMLGYGSKKLNWDDSYNVELYKNQGVARMSGNQTLLDDDVEDNCAIIAICEYPGATDGFVYARKDGKIKHYSNITRLSAVIFDYEKEITSVEFTRYLDGVVFFASGCEGYYYNVSAEDEKVKPLNIKDSKDDNICPDAACTFAGRIWLAKDSTVYFSALGRYDDWESENDAGYIANFHSSVIKISALALYCGNLAIFKSDGVYLLSGTSPDNFAVVKFADKGVFGSRAVCTCNNKQYFFNSDGLFALSQVGELSQIMMSGNIASPIENTFKEMDKSRISEAFCVPYEKKNQIWFYLPFAGNLYFQTIMIYDFANDCWTKRIEEQNITCAANVYSEVVSGCSGGRILMENIGSTFDGEPIKFSFSTPFFHLGKPSERKIIEDFALLLDETGENRFKFSVSKDFVKEIRSDWEYIKTTQTGSLIWASFDEAKTAYNCFETSYNPTWARSYQSTIGVQIFDSNLSVALHIEGEEEGDGFKLVGIEFKELLNDF